jgi:hypothetical protein
MNPLYYSLLHVFALFVLAAHTFMAFANPAPENRKRTMMITGIASLLAIGSAGGLMARHGYSWGSGWVIVKLVCWLGCPASPALSTGARNCAGCWRQSPWH